MSQNEKVTKIRQDDGYKKQIGDALDGAYKRAVENEPTTGTFSIDINTDRYIIFSDQHRGGRNRADDFRHAERAYNAAMAYYYHRGHTLVVLGDAEELWEERPPTVVENYQHSLELEAKFYHDNRYLRFWGNHDDNWQYDDQVRKHLGKIFDKNLKAHEALRINVMDGEEQIGTFFFAHGHQGTTESDRFAWFSKFVVRYFWRPFQRLTGISLNTPAKDWYLRERHNIAMYTWAERQEKLALIAGHTHRPVFRSKTHPAKIEAELKELEAKLAANPSKELRRQVSEKAALLEWIRSQEGVETGPEGQIIGMSKPCYFNTGCCSFSDGDITGIEIGDGYISLVRWPTRDDKPLPDILETASLREDIFAQL